MPGTLTQDTPFETITIKELHPSYGAEIIGCDFSNMSEKQLQEIKAAMAKVHHAFHRIPSVRLPAR
jgi:alpha-ketoglutarate-dependent 2,4-dichlorophenoxyacetate dioxygenase